VALLGPAARARRRQGGWPRRGSRGLRTSSGAFKAVWRTRPWASRRRWSTRVRCTRRGGLTAARGNSGEQSRANEGSNGRIKDAGKLLTSRGSAGVMGQRRWHRDATGRRWQSSGCARTALVSVGRANQRGRAHRRVSRAANGEAELNMAKDGARARR
jgi:hypothetical protein